MEKRRQSIQTAIGTMRSALGQMAIDIEVDRGPERVIGQFRTRSTLEPVDQHPRIAEQRVEFGKLTTHRAQYATQAGDGGADAGGAEGADILGNDQRAQLGVGDRAAVSIGDLARAAAEAPDLAFRSRR